MADGDEAKIAGCHVAELGSFFNAHDQWLFGHACVRTSGDRELAADLVQDTFEAAARAWPALREHDAGRQRAWLVATVANKNVSEFRRQEAFRRRQSDIHVRYQPTAADTAAQALNDHMKTTEIAAELGLAEGTVHAHLHAARVKLTAGLKQYYPFDENDNDKDDKARQDDKDDSGRGAAS
jgi:DNA-directed RNA polymerase specialized sigma24 family protein